MKIKKHVLALGLSAGLAATYGPSFKSQYSVMNETQVGYWVAKETTEKLGLDEDEASAVELTTTAAGTIAGATTGALLGAKLGSLGGPIGTVVGAAVGAL